MMGNTVTVAETQAQTAKFEVPEPQTISVRGKSRTALPFPPQVKLPSKKKAVYHDFVSIAVLHHEAPDICQYCHLSASFKSAMTDR